MPPLQRLSRSALLLAALLPATLLTPAAGQPAGVIYANQGPQWTFGARNAFYTQDQGSQMIPLAWLKALKQSDGKPFLADSLVRYGYLPNTDPSNPSGLPVGFTSADTPQGPMAGMTCAACHTRQIAVGAKALRIDGGPAIADFETFLADLDAAMLDVFSDTTKFKAFAVAVLGASAGDSDIAILRADATVWSVRFHTMMARALPTKRRWGPSRLDAVGMIFNRVTGLDLGAPPTFLIPDNVVPADAPARYPFLWNAARQDFTQWPGFAENGNDFFALSRNLGEVYGVFGTFHPRDPKGSIALFNRNYIADNSANFGGLDTLEGLIKRIGPPKWQWPVDPALVARGKVLFDLPNTNDHKGGCVGCHGIAQGDIRFPNFFTWKTPIQNVGTDQREWQVLTRYAASGSMEGAYIPKVVPTILKRDLAVSILKASVAGAIAEYAAWQAAGALDFRSRLTVPGSVGATIGPLSNTSTLTTSGAPDLANAQATIASVQNNSAQNAQLDATFRLPGLQSETAAASTAPAQNAYESRVLEGIWAAAPYLHNGSVPTLADLLKPADQRSKDFKIGPAYDLTTVGLAADQPGTTFTLHTTGCDDVTSGDSNCGHEYGTSLPDDDKKALLEYLKTL